MIKKSKLPEKSSRIAEIRETKWDQLIPEYLQSVTSQVSESARSQRFLLLLDDMFGIQPGLIEDYVAGIEKSIKVEQKDRILKGEVDNLFGNLVIEFERDLKKKQGEAENQLKKYVACLWSQESSSQRRPYLCLATDGVSFALYSPITDLSQQDIQPEAVNLKLIEQSDWSQLQPKEIYFWLDRYFLRQEILIPKSEDITKDFGAKSHAFQVVFKNLSTVWESLREKSEFKTIFESWEKYLRIAYGTDIGKEDLFCRHTYLSTLAKLMVWYRFTEAIFENKQMIEILSGTFFKKFGIENFLEEDLFSWIVREDAKQVGLDNASMLLSLLKNYNLRELSEDVLKSLYQELVDPLTRHDLGEFYTPDWLAHRMIQKLLENNIKNSFIDPSCGSGTFLYLTIKEKRQNFPHQNETLEHILNSVYGLDIHPLAVIIAKTNYLLALGDLLKIRKGKINIPVYLTDSIRFPEKELTPTLWIKIPSYKVQLDGKTIYIPEKLLETPSLYDEAIDAATVFAQINVTEEKVSDAQFFAFLEVQYPNLAVNKDIALALFYISEILKEFIIERRDTIWAFILKNIYKPLFLKEKFDIVVGNPPWFSFRDAEPSYQKFLREQIINNYQLLLGRAELITHLELATLFFLRTADLYLKEGGTIAFVLPKSIFTTDQHDGLRKGNFKGINLAFKEIWDLEEVVPLFNVPSCVLLAEKKQDAKISYPISGQKVNGLLNYRNASLEDAEKNLAVQNVNFYLHKKGKRSYWDIDKNKDEVKVSFYKRHFFQGATIVPRSLWFVQIKSTSFGLNSSFPPVESSEKAKNDAKKAYQGLMMEGNIERKFLYATLLSTDLLPFGHLNYRLVLLPIELSENSYKLINFDEAKDRGFFHLAQWLEKAQKEWEIRRGTKAKSMTIYERLDRYRRLSKQNPQTKYRVLYPDINRLMLSVVIPVEKPIRIQLGEQVINVNGYITDCKNYDFETNNQFEAYYLCAVLNSNIIDTLLGPLRRREQRGHPDVHKKIFDVASIPQFDPKNPDHLRLAELGKECSEKVANWIEEGGVGKITNIGFLRRKVRELLNNELREIDMLVKNIVS